MDLENAKIAVVGLGYVGLPLAIAFAKKYRVVGYDIDEGRVMALNAGQDSTHEADLQALANVVSQGRLHFTAQPSLMADCNIYIITVPTPIDHLKQPHLKPLLNATATIGTLLKANDVVIYESTVYPGCTEEDCVPVLEQASNLRFNIDFYGGYSPERINPGDKTNTLTNIKKVTSGSTPVVAHFVDRLYQSIIKAGTHLAPSIRIAEASKAIENAQRDVNISFVNELALIFDKMGIDTAEVLAAAATKWNFLPFKPGLVGGHCISVDPYYLAHKSEALGYKPEVILSGRRVNDNMGVFVAGKLVKLMLAADKAIKNAKVLILGFAFKENCPDTRNTRVIDIYNELRSYGIQVDVYDPLVDNAKVEQEHGFACISAPQLAYDGIILAVAHHQVLSIDFESYRKKGCVIFDCKSVLDRALVAGRL